VTELIAITPVSQPLVASIRPPGSKSITNRALVCAALAQGCSRLIGALASEDTEVMVESLQKLGIGVQSEVAGPAMLVTGCGGEIPTRSAELFVGNSGTTIRFLASMLAACGGHYRLDGIERMRARPMGDLLAALRRLGADAVSERENGCPPVVIRSNGLAGGGVQVRGDVSSQFLSGLLMAAPYARSPLELLVDGELVSQPYVRMTLAVMKAFGVSVAEDSLQRFFVAAPRSYRGCDYAVEPDASAASYFWGAAAITGGSITVTGLTRRSLQGDVAFCDCLARMGCEVQDHRQGITVQGRGLQGIEANMNAISDTVQTLAAVALFARGPTTITGVGHIRHKETDRISDLARELRKLGAAVDELADGLRITPGRLAGAEIETYKDHRMAMSLALVGLRVPGVVVRDPGCTRKTYPRYFEDLEAVCGARCEN
jgi:3-phosphoshikimate 1-carboxyvinyltransferase